MAIVDYNKRTGGGASNVSTNRRYSDLNLDFIKNTATQDISPLKDLDAGLIQEPGFEGVLTKSKHNNSKSS